MEVLQDLWTGAGLNAIEGPGVYYTHPHHLRDGHAILLALAARFRQTKTPSLGSRNSTPAASKFSRNRRHTYRFFSFALAVLRRTTFAATRRLCALPAQRSALQQFLPEFCRCGLEMI